MLKETIEQRVNVITGLPMQGQRATGRTTAIAMSAIGLALASGQAKCVDHEYDLSNCPHLRSRVMLSKVNEVIQTLNLKGVRAYIGQTHLEGYHVVIDFQPEQVVYYDLRK